MCFGAGSLNDISSKSLSEPNMCSVARLDGGVVIGVSCREVDEETMCFGVLYDVFRAAEPVFAIDNAVSNRVDGEKW